MKSTVTRPTNNIWSASVTILGYDENGLGSTIEMAYKDLVDTILSNQGYMFYVIENQNK